MSYWDKEEVISEIHLSEKSKIVVSAVEKNGKQFVNVREFYCTSQDPTWKASKNGMPVQYAYATALAEGISKAGRVWRDSDA